VSVCLARFIDPSSLAAAILAAAVEMHVQISIRTTRWRSNGPALRCAAGLIKISDRAMPEPDEA